MNNGAEKLTFDHVRARAELDEYPTDVALREALENAAGLKDHTKAGLLYHIAWTDAHSHGMLEVVDRYEELSELLK